MEGDKNPTATVGENNSSNSLYYLCPMHWFKGSPSAVTGGAHVTPPTGTCPITGKKVESGIIQGAESVSANVAPNLDATTTPSCPVKHTAAPVQSQATSSTTAPQATQPNGASACPVQYKNKNVYNVYSQPIDPTNQMPMTANQLPAPGQEESLETNRVKSTIPKGGTEDTWVYPSPQMFWNALVRKNKVDGASERDMSAVVAVHNNMNEGTWRQVLSWEQLHEDTYHADPSTGRNPKLLRFLGRPDDLSPKARLKMLFGHSAPFDRHDWVVDRGGEEVRYVIDYYHDESGVSQDQLPKHMHDFDAMRSIVVDVRPALDSPKALFDVLLRMPLARVLKKTDYAPPSFFPPSQMAIAEMRKIKTLQSNWNDIIRNCEEHKQKLNACESEEECGAAAIALQRCTASVVCPSVATEFDNCIKAQSQLTVDEEKLAKAFKEVQKCLEMFRLDCATYLPKK